MADLRGVIDRLPRLQGRATLFVYDGEIEWVEDAGVARPRVWRRDEEGRLLRPVHGPTDVITAKNLVVTNGKNLLLDRLFGTGGPPAAVGSIGVGTDSTAAAVGQTQLNPSVAGSVLLQAQDASFPSRSAQTTTNQGTFGTGVANFQWNECGLFNGNTNGTSTMFDRIVIGPFTKTSAVSIVLQITVTQS